MTLITSLLRLARRDSKWKGRYDLWDITKVIINCTITISNEIILLSIGMLEVRFSGKSDLEQETLYQGAEEVVFSITNTTEFHVRPKISLENKVYP